MYDWDDDNCAMDAVKFKKVREKCKDLLAEGWEISKLVACIYDIYQHYRCAEEQENELYNLVDPNEQFNEVGDYYMEMDYENPLLEIA